MTYKQWFDENRQSFVETLQRWVRIPSVKEAPKPGAPFGEGNRVMLEEALALASAMGMRTKNLDGYIGYAEIGEGEECLGILVHLDVVPVGEGWTKEPFGGELIGDDIYGRGTGDDKGPAVASLFALKAVMDMGIPLKRRVRLIFGCDEESGWEDIAHYKKHDVMPDFGLSPDAGFPVITTEKGILNLRISGSAPQTAGAIVAANLSGGERANVVPARATCEITGISGEDLLERVRAFMAQTGYPLDVEVTDGRVILGSTGVGSHGAAPATGRNAVRQLAQCLLYLGLQSTALDLLGQTLTDNGDVLGIDGNDFSGALTLNMGLGSWKNDQVEAILDIRYPVSRDEEALIETIRRGVAPLTVEKFGGKGPLNMPEDHMLVKKLLEVYTRVTSNPPGVLHIGGGTYARAMKNAVAFGAGLPGIPGGAAHQADEYVRISGLLIAGNIYAQCIEELCGPDAPPLA